MLSGFCLRRLPSLFVRFIRPQNATSKDSIFPLTPSQAVTAKEGWLHRRLMRVKSHRREKTQDMGGADIVRLEKRSQDFTTNSTKGITEFLEDGFGSNLRTLQVYHTRTRSCWDAPFSSQKKAKPPPKHVLSEAERRLDDAQKLRSSKIALMASIQKFMEGSSEVTCCSSPHAGCGGKHGRNYGHCCLCTLPKPSHIWRRLRLS